MYHLLFPSMNQLYPTREFETSQKITLTQSMFIAYTPNRTERVRFSNLNPLYANISEGILWTERSRGTHPTSARLLGTCSRPRRASSRGLPRENSPAPEAKRVRHIRKGRPWWLYPRKAAPRNHFLGHHRDTRWWIQRGSTSRVLWHTLALPRHDTLSDQKRLGTTREHGQEYSLSRHAR